jgi:hypothetical protein
MLAGTHSIQVSMPVLAADSLLVVDASFLFQSRMDE